MRTSAWIGLALLVAITAGCRGGGTVPPARVETQAVDAPALATAPATRATEKTTTTARSAGRDLQADEALGGHTLSRHVGRTDGELAQRLKRERDISAASTYTDRATAERVVGQAIEQAHDRIETWAHRQGNRPNLVLHFTQSSGPPIGRSLSRGTTRTRPCEGALVVLRWDGSGRRWFVLTSYPEVGR